MQGDEWFGWAGRRRVVGDGQTYSGGRPFGPIRPEHAADGWELAGSAAEWWLIKDFPGFYGQVRGTTATTCAWRIYRIGGRLVREASARSVADARAAADAWVRSMSHQD
jgi:hypothetical protein